MRNNTEAWDIMGNDSKHRYPIITPKQVRDLMEYAKDSPFEVWALRGLCDVLSSAILGLNNVVASYKWQLKTLKAENEALRDVLKKLTK